MTLETAELTDYRLPDGRVVPVGDACRNQVYIDYTLADGTVVQATRLDCWKRFQAEHRHHVWNDLVRLHGMTDDELHPERDED